MTLSGIYHCGARVLATMRDAAPDASPQMEVHMPVAAGEKTQFIVHLEGLRLPPDAEATIAREIRAAALRELARLDLKADFGVRIPRKEWLGLWLDHIPGIPMPRPEIHG